MIVDTLINLLFALIFAGYCFIKLNVRIKLHSFGKETIKEICNYSVFIFILALVNQLFWRIGHFALGIVADTSAVAVYAISIVIVVYYQQLALSISGLFLPKVSKMVATGSDSSELTSLMIRVGRFQLAILGLVLTGFSLLGRQFILLWAGAEYCQAFWIILFIFISLTFQMTQTIGGVILKVKNLVSFKAKAYLTMAVINLVFSIFFAIRFGAIGVGITTAISIIVFQVIVINIYYKYKVGRDIYRFIVEVKRGILPTILFSIILGYGTLFIPGDGWTAFIMRVLIITFIYSFLIITIGFKKYEKRMILGPIINRLGNGGRFLSKYIYS